MYKLVILVLALCSNQAFAAATASNDSNVLFEVSYGLSSVSPAELNTARQNFYWNSTGLGTGTPGTGSFGSLLGFGINLGYKALDPAYLLLHYEQTSQSLSPLNVAVNGANPAFQLTESFHYSPIYLLADYPIPAFDDVSFSLRGGVGYALNYELLQKNSFGQSLEWGANPIVFRVGGTVCYSFTKSAGMFAEVAYESAKGELKSLVNSSATVNNVAVYKGMPYPDFSTGGGPTSADISGMRYNLGFRFQF